MKSFSNLVKEELAIQDIKQKLCCSFSLLYGMFGFLNHNKDNMSTFSTSVENVNLFKNTCEFINTKKNIKYSINGRKISIDSNQIRYFTVAEIKNNVFKCNHCRENFLKGLFLTHGTINDPEKSYRLDIVLNTEDDAIQVNEYLNEFNIAMKISKRSNKYVLYTKDSECIEDFLALIGAKNSAFTVINSKILKELRNTANRITNCDQANINKTVEAAKKYCIIIEKIIKEGYFEELPDSLKEMATKRLEFNNLNFADLGKKFNPPISKSGVYHRLEKIIAFYDKVQEENKR